MRFMVLGRDLYHSVYLIPTPVFSKGTGKTGPLTGVPILENDSLRDTFPVVAEATRPALVVAEATRPDR
jgi:hypothetical protein